jgi:hypothetical protein
VNGKPPNKPLERTGMNRRGEGNRRRAGRSAPISSPHLDEMFFKANR